MEDRILITGGTGTLGRLVVPLLRERGHDVRILSRRDGPGLVTGDLETGEGVADAAADATTIVHLAGSAKRDDVKARVLSEAAARAGARHLVYISVVGADRIPVVTGIDRALFGYYAAKHEAERVIAGSGVPWTTLRATQFHDLLLKTFRALARVPVVPVLSAVRFQPVDARDVADRIAALALGPPAGLVPDLAGPRVYEMRDLLRGYLVARRRHRLLVPMRQPGQAARAFRDGANLSPEHADGRRTWEAFLAERVA